MKSKTLIQLCQLILALAGCVLIGWCVYLALIDPSPLCIAIQSACICANIAFVAVNMRGAFQ